VPLWFAQPWGNVSSALHSQSSVTWLWLTCPQLCLDWIIINTTLANALSSMS